MYQISMLEKRGKYSKDLPSHLFCHCQNPNIILKRTHQPFYMAHKSQQLSQSSIISFYLFYVDTITDWSSNSFFFFLFSLYNYTPFYTYTLTSRLFVRPTVWQSDWHCQSFEGIDHLDSTSIRPKKNDHKVIYNHESTLEYLQISYNQSTRKVQRKEHKPNPM